MGESADPLGILIVEDEPLIAMELESEFLALRQKVVGIASDSKQALTIAGSTSPHLAIVDVNLRDGATGPQLAVQLTTAHKISVVFLTATPHRVPKGYCGALGVITKPWKPAIMGELVDYVCAHRRSDWEAVKNLAPKGLELAPLPRSTFTNTRRS